MYRRQVIVAMLFVVTGCAYACSTLRVGSQVLTVGDSAVHTLDLLGTPAYKEPVENEFGAYAGERWQYQRDGRVITVIIIHGRVNDIQDRHS